MRRSLIEKQKHFNFKLPNSMFFNLLLNKFLWSVPFDIHKSRFVAKEGYLHETYIHIHVNVDIQSFILECGWISTCVCNFKYSIKWSSCLFTEDTQNDKRWWSWNEQAISKFHIIQSMTFLEIGHLKSWAF